MSHTSPRCIVRCNSTGKILYSGWLSDCESFIVSRGLRGLAYVV